VAEYCAQTGASIALFTDSALAPLVRYANLKFTIATRGASWFDSYTAGIALINAFLAEYVRLAGKSARERYAIRERLFRHFEIFAGHDGPPDEAGNRDAKAVGPGRENDRSRSRARTTRRGSRVAARVRRPA
jgi:hypothetical protein